MSWADAVAVKTLPSSVRLRNASTQLGNDLDLQSFMHVKLLSINYFIVNYRSLQAKVAHAAVRCVRLHLCEMHYSYAHLPNAIQFVLYSMMIPLNEAERHT